MSLKRYIVEFGMGADLHGQDVTKAAVRAVKDAVSRSCLCGLFDICGMEHPGDMRIHLKIGCPDPEQLDEQRVLQAVPFGAVELESEAGGLKVHGLKLPVLGPGDNIVIAVAAVTVFVNCP